MDSWNLPQNQLAKDIWIAQLQDILNVIERHISRMHSQEFYRQKGGAA